MCSIELLNEKIRPYFYNFLSELENRNLAYKVLETLRSKDTQLCYFQQGRKPLNEVNELRKKCGLY